MPRASAIPSLRFLHAATALSESRVPGPQRVMVTTSGSGRRGRLGDGESAVAVADERRRALQPLAGDREVGHDQPPRVIAGARVLSVYAPWVDAAERALALQQSTLCAGAGAELRV